MIPSAVDLRSDPLTHRFGDVFNPPGLTNFLGVVQVDTDPTGLRGFNCPPIAFGDTVTATLLLDSEYVVAAGDAITYTWYPDRVERRTRHRGVEITSTVAMVAGERAVVMRLELSVRSGEEREVEVGLLLRGGVTSSRAGWSVVPPMETDNTVVWEAPGSAVVFAATQSSAVLVQGVDREARFDGRVLRTRVAVAPGRATTVDFAAVLGEHPDAAVSFFTQLVARVGTELERARDCWNEELRLAFTPGNARYSGNLPELHTADADIQRLYNNAVVGLLYFRRDNPASVHGRAWDTLMPRYWSTVTFIWDYHLSSLSHALLDPVVMRGYLERWMNVDVHRYFGTEYLGGEGVGLWYAVNDYAMVSMAADYLAWTGDRQWLSHTIPGRAESVLDLLEGYALQWRQFETGSGLANYGAIGNLLECVDSYINEVASLNAANVWAMRAVADLVDGQVERAQRLREAAEMLSLRVRELYANGQGFWRARYPDGSLVDVRHAYDFQTILTTIADDLPPEVRAEMAEFFIRELVTPLWMRSLSASDPSAAFSVRADHQWTGAYTAWPPKAAQALFAAGEGAAALRWLRGLASSANQGPFGQAHFIERAFPPDAGGARKAPPELPYITDWACSSSGSWLSVIIESLFGVRASLRDGISASPQFHDFDPDARLTGIRCAGRLYTATAAGVAAEPD